VTPNERWLDANWPFVSARIPVAPARVVEIGCGPLGGFVPMLESAGYQATGVDPEAPDEPSYRRIEFERSEVPGPVDAVVASASLHHVADVGKVLDLVNAMLAPGGLVLIVEWAQERFDEATARWCFARLPRPEHVTPAKQEHEPEHDHNHDHGWLHQRQADWQQSGRSWDDYLRSWAEAEGIHAGHDILTELDARFDSQHVTYGPYFFTDLAGTSEADEQAAIDAGLIQATRIQYAGRRRNRRPAPPA